MDGHGTVIIESSFFLLIELVPLFISIDGATFFWLGCGLLGKNTLDYFLLEQSRWNQR
jgi:hypothetical protein